MKGRLEVARQFLRDDGVIFISIDDNEMHYLKILCDEIFGRDNFIASIPRKTRSGKADVPYNLSQDFDWMLVYSKSGNARDKIFKRQINRKYYKSSDFKDEWRLNPLTTQRTIKERPNSDFTIVNPKNKQEFPVNPNSCWRITKDTFPEYLQQNKIVFPGDYAFLNIKKPMLRIFKTEDIEKKGEDWNKAYVSSNVLNQAMNDFLAKFPNAKGTKEIISHFGTKVFAFPKPVGLIQKIIEVTTDKDDLVLDFFAGSGTTGEAVIRQNQEDGGSRRFILIEQLEEHVKICRQRLVKVLRDENSEDTFIYFELAKYNEQAKQQVLGCSNSEQLEKLFDELNKRYFLVYNLEVHKLQQKIEQGVFKTLSLQEQQRLLIEMLDLNQMYILASEMTDTKFSVSQRDCDLTGQFYNS